MSREVSLLEQKRPRGKKATIFVYVFNAVDNMAYVANSVSLVTYFTGYMNLSLVKSANTLTNFLGASFILAIFGGLISDTYLTRFKTSVLFGCLEMLGYAILTVQAHFPELRPSIPCKDVKQGQCKEADSGQQAILLIGLYLVALGNSGVRAALSILGAEQFDENDPQEAAQKSSFFNWFLFSCTIGVIFGVTLLVWMTLNIGWDWEFGICSAAYLIVVLLMCSGKSLFRDNVHKGSPLLRILQVFVAAARNRDIPVPEMRDKLYEIHDIKEMKHEILQRTNQFRFLDRAAVMRTSGGSSAIPFNPWRLCTVTQVEETKILIRMSPIALCTVFITTCLAQLETFTTQQSLTLDTHFLGFKIPGPSLSIIPQIFNLIFIAVYDRLFVPFARRITGIPSGIQYLQRVGVGLLLTAVSMAVAGIVERRRKSVAFHQGMVDSAEPLPMTVFWLGFQYAIFGLSDLFTIIGLMDFYYSESSTGMKSMAMASLWCSMAFGYFTSSVVVEVVNRVSGGWLASNNLNRDKLDYFYWLLAGLSMLNFCFFMFCASWYKYKKVEVKPPENFSGDAQVYSIQTDCIILH